MKFLIYCFLNLISVLVILPLSAQVLPKFCGTEFTVNNHPYCVKTLASSDSHVIIEIVSPLLKWQEETLLGLEYRQYQFLTTCDQAQLPLNNDFLFLIQIRYLDNKGKVIVPNATSEALKPVTYDSDLAWKAYQVSCDRHNSTSFLK